jgi:hypothetical protein
MFGNTTALQGRTTHWYLCTAAGVGGGLLNWFGIRHRIWMAPDSWAFWEGSISLLDGRGYCLFLDNEPIKSWPPLYSLYLAAWQLPFGVSGATLILAQCFLAVISAFGWSAVALSFYRRLNANMNVQNSTIDVLSCAFVATLVAREFFAVRADNLKYALLPAMIALVDKLLLLGDRSKVTTPRYIATGVVGAALMLTHTSSIAFIVAVVATVWFTPETHVRGRLLGALILGATALAPWLVLRSILGQQGSHAIGMGAGTFSPVEYAVQMVGGGLLLLSKQRSLAIAVGIGMVATALFAYSRERLPGSAQVILRGRLVFVGVACLVLYVLFNVTSIADMLTGRFLLFIPLILAPLAIGVVANRSQQFATGLAAAILLVGIPRTLQMIRGAESIDNTGRARPEQLVYGTDCIQHPDGSAIWRCGSGTTARIPPSMR